MKANDVPEKIFVHKSQYWGLRANEHDITKNGIEYVRKDAFIEKACEWLRTHSEADYFELIPSYNYCGAGNLKKKKMIEDFKKYMEDKL